MAMATLLFVAVYPKKSDGFNLKCLCFLQIILFFYSLPSATVTAQIYDGRYPGSWSQDDNMRVKLSSLHPSQLLPRFKADQPRFPGISQSIRGLSQDNAVPADPNANLPNPDSTSNNPQQIGIGNKGENQPAGNPAESQGSSYLPSNVAEQRERSPPILQFQNVGPGSNYPPPSSPIAANLLRNELTKDRPQSYVNPGMSPMPQEAPRPPSPFSPLNMDNIRRSGGNSPEIQIVLDNRPLPPYQTIQTKPGGSYLAVPLPGGGQGYRIDGPGLPGSPTMNSPSYIPRQISPRPMPYPQISNNMMLSPPSPLQPNIISNAGGVQNDMPGNVSPPNLQSGRGIAQAIGQVGNAPISYNGQSQSNQGFYSQPSNAQLENDYSFYKNQQQPIMGPPFPITNSAATNVQQRPPLLSAALMGARQSSPGQMKQSAISSQQPQNPGTTVLRNFLSSPPLNSLQHHIPVRSSTASDNLNAYRNGVIVKQPIFQPAALQSPRFNNQNQLSPHGSLPQYSMGQTLPNIFQQGSPIQNGPVERSRSPTYFPRQPSPPLYSPPQQNRESFAPVPIPAAATLQRPDAPYNKQFSLYQSPTELYGGSARGRFMGQAAPRAIYPKQRDLQDLQPRELQDYYRKVYPVEPAQFRGPEAIRYQYSGPLQRNFRGPATQQEKIQPTNFQRLQGLREEEYRNHGKIQQIPPRGNQAGGQYQQIQPNDPSRQIQYPQHQQDFSRPYFYRGASSPSLSPLRPQPSYTPAVPFGYGGSQQFVYPQNDKGLIQRQPYPQTSQYPFQGSGLRTYATDGQIGPIKVSPIQRNSPTPYNIPTIPRYEKPVEPYGSSPYSGVNVNYPQTGNNNIQSPLRSFPRYPSPTSNNDQRGPHTGPNQFDPNPTGVTNGNPYAGSVGSGSRNTNQPILQNELPNTNNNRVPEFLNLDAQSRPNAGSHEIPASRAPNSEAIKGPQETSLANTPKAAPSILPFHRGAMPFYSQSQVDSHHRRLLENNQTKEDSEFESDSKLLQWYLQRAKQVLQHPNDNSETNKASSTAGQKHGNDGSPSNGSPSNGSPSNGNAGGSPHVVPQLPQLPHAATSPSNSQLSPIPRTASPTANSPNGTGELRKHSGDETRSAAASPPNNPRGLSQSPSPLPANVLHQPAAVAVGAQNVDNKPPSSVRKHRSTSFEDLYDFLLESDVNVNAS